MSGEKGGCCMDAKPKLKATLASAASESVRQEVLLHLSHGAILTTVNMYYF